jgi:hypothetical protein
MTSTRTKGKWYALKIQEQRKFVNENENIHISLIENQNILEKKRSEEKRKIMMSLRSSSKNKGYLKRIYMREGKKEKKRKV